MMAIIVRGTQFVCLFSIPPFFLFYLFLFDWLGLLPAYLPNHSQPNCLLLCQSMYPHAHPSVHLLCICFSICLFIYLSIYSLIHLFFICLPVSQFSKQLIVCPVPQSDNLAVCQFVYPPISWSICLSLHQTLFSLFHQSIRMSRVVISWQSINCDCHQLPISNVYIAILLLIVSAGALSHLFGFVNCKAIIYIIICDRVF